MSGSEKAGWQVSYEDLSLLTEDDLVQLGLMTIGPRRRLVTPHSHPLPADAALQLEALGKRTHLGPPEVAGLDLAQHSQRAVQPRKAPVTDDEVDVFGNSARNHHGDNTYRTGTPPSVRVSKSFDPFSEQRCRASSILRVCR